MLQQSLILSFLLSWAAGFVFYADLNTAVAGETLDVHWAKELNDGELDILGVTLVSDASPALVSWCIALVGEKEEGNVTLQVPSSTQPGNYIVKAYRWSNLDSIGTFPIQLVSPSTTSEDLSSTSLAGQSTSWSTSTLDTGQTTSLAPNSPSTTSGSTGHTSKTPILVGSILGAFVVLVLIILAILVILWRRKTKRETIQFYGRKMVRHTSPSPLDMDPPVKWERLNQRDTLTPSRYAGDVKQSFEPEPLPAYGYSNYDFIEKADYQDTSSLPSLSYGAMPDPTSLQIPQIVVTSATPPESELSVSNGSW